MLKENVSMDALVEMFLTRDTGDLEIMEESLCRVSVAT